MTDFGSTFSAALRDEVQEIAMSVDLNEGAQRLQERLDRAYRSEEHTSELQSQR